MQEAVGDPGGGDDAGCGEEVRDGVDVFVEDFRSGGDF